MPEHDGADGISDEEFDRRARELALDIEQAIEDAKRTNEKWRGVFEQRSHRAKQLEQAYPEVVDEPRD